ncbi:hypothetical protein CMV_027877, partial [Castanea mollissima]
MEFGLTGRDRLWCWWMW